MQKITVRRGKPEDAHHFSELVALSSPALFLVLFGSKVKRLMEKLFPHKRHYYSFDRSFFIEVDGNTAGMAQLHRFRPRRREKINLTFLLMKYMNWRLPSSVAPLLMSEKIIRDFSGRDCYLSNVAVYPEYRSLGLGSKLLGAIEEEVKSAGKNRIVLHADAKNHGAIRLYERLGYRIEEKSPTLKIRNKYFDYLIIKKNLAS
ncbi:MAG: GNAT family N-acetyltransferase [Candidatus Omnitrophota bacterium]|nr:GNAT family N-acetyltransferase [Candidatus Omnitrophota bacterium]